MKQQNYVQTKFCLAGTCVVSTSDLCHLQSPTKLLMSRSRGPDWYIFIQNVHSCQNKRTMNISDVRILMCAAFGDEKSLSL